MANQIAKDIVGTALSLQEEHPAVPALEVLDVAMLGRADSEPVFKQSEGEGRSIDLARADSNFGRLLAAAFLLPGQSVAAHEWGDKVLVAFARRYNLWSRRANLPASTWQTRCFQALRAEDPSLQSGWEDESELPPNQMDEHEVLECLAMTTVELYESPMSDGLTPEAVVAQWRASTSSTLVATAADFQSP